MTFEAILSSIPTIKSLNSVDYNNDGFEDIIASYTNHVSIFENNINQAFSNEISVYQDNNLIMGKVERLNVDNQGGLEIVWSGGTNAIAFHLNESPLSIDEAIDLDLIVYPNPSDGIFHFSETIPKMTVYNALGKLCFESSNINIINLTNYSNGVYFLKLEMGETVLFQKVLKR